MSAREIRNLVTIVQDPGLRSVLKDFISGDYDLVSTENGRQAFNQLALRYFDVVITDLEMPGLGGGNVANLMAGLKRIQPWARIIVIPSRKLSHRDRKAVEATADVCLEKPFEVDQLKAILAKMLGRPKDRRDAASAAAWKSGDLTLEPG